MNNDMYIELLEKEVERLKRELLLLKEGMVEVETKAPHLTLIKPLFAPDVIPSLVVAEPKTETPSTILEVAKDFLDVSTAKDIPVERFDAMFEQGKIIIETDNHGFTPSWGVWFDSDAVLHVPKGATPCFELVRGCSGYALAESFMFEGLVYNMDKRAPKMFSTVGEMREYAETLFAVFLAYVWVSPLDKVTPRYFILGCQKEDGFIPTHGL